MKNQGIKLPEVKSKAAARKQAAYCLIQLENRNRKRDRLMNNQHQIQEKVARLQKQLEQLSETISQIEIGDQDWRDLYEKLMTEHQLLESEILEIKADLLLKKINEMESTLGASPEPKADKILPEG